MNDILSVFKYTFLENIRKKVFIISTLIAMLLAVAVMNIPAILNLLNSSKDTSVGNDVLGKKNGIVYLVDSKEIFKNDLNDLSQTIPSYELKKETADSVENIKKQVKDGKAEALIVVDKKGDEPYFDFWVQQIGHKLDPNVISASMKEIFSNKLLKTSNVPDKIIQTVLGDVSFNVKEFGKGFAISTISSFVVSSVLFLAIFFFSYGVSTSIASEKSSRVMEILLTSTKPKSIILGKSIAMGLLGIMQILLIMISVIITFKISFPKDFSIGGSPVSFSFFTPFVFDMVVLYFILGYSLYSMMNAVAGSTVSKAEDLNIAIMPFSLLALISCYLGYTSVLLPGTIISDAASIFPLSAPFSMPIRLITESVPLWQVAISILTTVLSIIFMAWLSIRLYSSAVLHYGKRLNVFQLAKMAK